MISLKKVMPEDREILWNIHQKYLYEMTNYYPDPMDEKGNLHYGYFEEYFRDPRRTAYFLMNGAELVGFAIGERRPGEEILLGRRRAVNIACG